jgi:predicted Zn-dependent protease
MNANKNIYQDKRYTNLKNNFQKGNFTKSQSLLNILLREYPGNSELLEIKDRLNLKTMHSRASKEKETSLTSKQIMVWSGVVLAAALVIWGVFFGIQRYKQLVIDKTSEFEISEQLEQTNNLIESNLGKADVLIESGRYNDALVVLEEIESMVSEDPEYQGLLKRANDGIYLVSVYEDALSMGEQLDFESALEQLKVINNVNPDFRDVQILIAQYEREIELRNFLELADKAYETGDWDAALENYEKYLLDVENNEKLEEKQKLYNSYMNVINENLSEETMDIDVIEQSESLLSKARTLYLHNTIKYSFEDNRRIQELLVAKFVNLGEQNLVESPDNINAIRAAEYYYSKALQQQPNSQELIDKYVLINDFMNGYSYFIDGSWVEAEENFRQVYERDPGFAGGLAEVFLYETYTVMGKLYEEIEYYVSANNSYKSAEIIAKNDQNNELRIFEVSVNLARMQAKYGDHKAASLKFLDAFDDSGLYELSQYYGGELAGNLRIAYDSIYSYYYYTAYVYFIAAIEDPPEFIDQDFVWLEEDSSLAKLCLEYSSTFSYIFEFNDLNYSMLPIETGTGIIVPSLP